MFFLNRNTILISDTHFGNKNINKWQKWRTKIEKKRKMTFFDICNLLLLTKAIKGNTKNVFHLGDYQEKAQEVFKVPNTLDVYLLKGNHDTSSTGTYKYLGLNILEKTDNLYFVIKEIDGVKIMFTHYPLFNNCEYDKKEEFYKEIKSLEKLFKQEECEINIHGHTHNKESDFKYGYNISIDYTKEDLVTIGDIIDLHNKNKEVREYNMFLRLFLILAISFSLGSALERIDVSQSSKSNSNEEYVGQASGILGDAFSPLTKYNRGTVNTDNLELNQIEKVRTKLQLKKNNIKYKKSYEAYSIIPHDQEALKDWLYDSKIPPFAFEYAFGYADTVRELRISALGYDWGEGSPDKAQEFYDILINSKDVSFGDKIHTADFFFRTGQIKKVKRVLSNSVCSTSIKGQYVCHYYRGLAIYLISGDNRNQSLSIASRAYPQAKLIYGKSRW